MNKLKILTFVGYYLPGYKSGGPLRTIVNMVEHLGDEFEFFIVTRDRDLGDVAPYENVENDEWHQIGKARVYYLSPEKNTIKNLINIISNNPHDILYLNSFFDPTFTIKPLLTRHFSKLARKPVIVAPRGEFSLGALSLKKTKKNLYIALSRLLNLYKDATFQASSEYEAKDIIDALGVPVDCVKIAIDLPDKSSLIVSSPINRQDANLPRQLRVIFLSRISRMKNLNYALQVLTTVTENIQFDIYGPLEDQGYWAECESLISHLPDNVSISYCGSVMPADVQNTFSQYDLFFFPTKGENYGHVIAESVSMGTPVLLSDQTPWKNLENDGLGWDLPLGSPFAFSEKLDQIAKLSPDIRQEQRAIVREQALKRLLNPEIIDASRELFYSQCQITTIH